MAMVQVSDGASGNSMICGQDAAQSDKPGFDSESDHDRYLEIGQAKKACMGRSQRRTRNSFTCEDFLVHNWDVEVRLRRAPAEEPERGYPDVGARAEIVAWNRKGLTFCSTSARQHRPHGRRLQRHFLQRPGRADAGEKLDKTIRRDNEEKPEGKPAQFADTSRWASAAFPVGTRLSSHHLVEHEHGEMQETGSARRRRRQAPPVGAGMLYARGYSAPDKQQGGQSTSSATSPANGQIVRGTLQTNAKRADHSRGAQQDQVAQHRIREIYRARAAWIRISPQRTD